MTEMKVRNMIRSNKKVESIDNLRKIEIPAEALISKYTHTKRFSAGGMS
jgi:hypothetical protein